jgi:hypothetical protein
MLPLDQTSARELIDHLKAGTTPLDLVRHINVGNERWYDGCNQYFDQVERSGDSRVRFVRGFVGDGKTHFLGMLRILANERQWAVGYVSAENTPFSRYDLIYARLAKNLVLPDAIPLVSWTPTYSRGIGRLLAAFFAQHYLKAYRKPDTGGLYVPGIYNEVQEKAENTLRRLAVHDSLIKAVRAYTIGALNEDTTVMQNIVSWLEGEPADVSAHGIRRKIDESVARDFLRGLSLLAQGAGIKGVLVLLDEAERILKNVRPIRQKSYGVIRDLLDNTDDQGGMPTSMFYIAATPDMFTKSEGFAEYEGLRSRLAASQRFSLPNFVDWRGVVLDLTRTPLSREDMLQLARKIREVHIVAEAWDAAAAVSDSLLEAIVEGIESGIFQVSKLRMLASSTATVIDIAQQNPGTDVASLLSEVFVDVAQTLSATAQLATKWD